MPPTLTYHRADTVDEAVALLAQLGDEAKAIAGGQSLMVLINLGLAQPTALVDIDRIPGLDHVGREGATLRIGALTRHAQIERHDGDLGGFSVLRRAAGLIAYPAIRARGTFGGTLAHADPTGEWCVLARLLDAEIVAEGSAGRRTIPAGAFFLGPLTTALGPDEVIVEVRFPQEPGYADLREVEPRHPDFETLIAAVAYDLDGRTVRRPRVALGGVAPEPVRVSEVETALEGADAGTESFRQAGSLASRSVEVVSDDEGRAYARQAVGALVSRALAGALDLAVTP